MNWNYLLVFVVVSGLWSYPILLAWEVKAQRERARLAAEALRRRRP